MHERWPELRFEMKAGYLQMGGQARNRSSLRLAGINIRVNHRKMVAGQCNAFFGAIPRNESDVVMERFTTFPPEATKEGQRYTPARAVRSFGEGA